MKNLICPVSPLRINENTARVTGFLMATTIVLYAFTGNISFIWVTLTDYFVRAFTTLKYSPGSWLASRIVQRLQLPEVNIDKAPKIFAARVGFLFAATSLGLFYINRKISTVVGLVLMAFALLESVFNFCVGCIVYTHVVLPIFKKKA
ncbi:MAG: hypothetical protein NVSMB38_12440 [Ktedonobacteraceae bacterium]